MVRKRKKKEELKIFCYYCDREFTDEATLIQHQKAKHFKCEQCHKKMSSSPGLVVHVFQVHKVALESVPNALPGRDDPSLNIFGMAGVPEHMMGGGGDAAQGEANDGYGKMARVDPAYGGYGYPPQGAYPGYAPAPYMPPPAYGQPSNMPPYGAAPRPGFAPPPYGGPPAATGPPRAPPALFPAARPSGALFPAGAARGPPGACGAPPHADSQQIPGLGGPSGAPQAQGPPGTQSRPVLLGDALLLWGEEDTSQEERRASLPKYSPAAKGPAGPAGATGPRPVGPPATSGGPPSVGGLSARPPSAGGVPGFAGPPAGAPAGPPGLGRPPGLAAGPAGGPGVTRPPGVPPMHAPVPRGPPGGLYTAPPYHPM